MEDILRFRELLHLNEYFPNLDNLLLMMIISPRRMTEHQIEELTRRYGLSPLHMNYEILEFYGDNVLNLILVDLIIQQVGLNNYPGKLTRIKSMMTKNESLTLFARQLGYCQEIFQIADEQDLHKHNLCADIFEALLGILHLEYPYDKIKEWFQSLTPVMDHLQQTIEAENIVYFGPTYKWTKNFPFMRTTASGLPSEILEKVMNEYLHKYPFIRFIESHIRGELFKLDIVDTQKNKDITLALYSPGDSGQSFSQRVLDSLDRSHIIRLT